MAILILAGSCISSNNKTNNTDDISSFSQEDSIAIGLINPNFNPSDDKPILIKIADSYKPGQKLNTKISSLNIKNTIREAGKNGDADPFEYQPLTREEQIKLSKNAAYEAGTHQHKDINSHEYYDTTNLAKVYFIEKPKEFIQLNSSYYRKYFLQGKYLREHAEQEEIESSRSEFLQ